MDKCFRCDGNLVSAFTNHMVDLGGRFIIIKNVPCFKCDECSDVAFAGDVTERLDEIVAKLDDTFVELAVIEYAT